MNTLGANAAGIDVLKLNPPWRDRRCEAPEEREREGTPRSPRKTGGGRGSCEASDSEQIG